MHTHPAFNHQQKEPMQIADGFVKTCPEMEHYIYGITPAEAVILKKMHNQYSNGTPLKGLVVVGDAKEVDQYGKPMMIGERKPFKRMIATMDNGNAAFKEVADWEMAYTPSEKPRTQSEEINRLRRKYVGNVTVNGRSISAWEAAFGGGELVNLPETFKEVEHIIGPCFTDNRGAMVSSPNTTIGESAAQVPIESIHAQAPKRLGRPPKQTPETAQV